jgi:hypothetical protein
VWRRSRLPESLKEMGDRKFFIHNMTQTAFLKAKEECNNNVKTPSDELCTPEATILCQAVLMVASESCLPPGRRCAALEEAQYQGGLRMAAEKLCMLPPRYAGGGQPEAIQYQGGLRTASEESCLPPGRAALSPTAGRRSQLPEPSREMDELCIPEAAVLCQAGLMVASESCLPPERAALGEAQYQGGLRMATEKLCMLPPRHAGGGQPEAAQYQGGLRTASEESCLPPGCAALSPMAWRRSRLPGPSREMDELCMPEAAVLCHAGLMVASESCLPPGRAALGEAQYLGGLRMAAEKLCMLPPGNAGGGQPEAAQYQGGLRTALEESCLPPGCAALGHAAWRRSQVPSRKRRRRRRTSAGTVGSLSGTTKYCYKPRRGQMTNPSLGGGRCQGRKGPIHYYN